MKTAAVAIVVSTLTTSLGAQWLTQPTKGIPRTADGKPNLAAPLPRTPDGTPDISGIWDRRSSDHVFDITVGLKPEDIQPWARALVEERKEDLGRGHMSVQCLPYGPSSVTYVPVSHTFMKIIQTPAVIIFLNADLTYRQIFMDGRALEADPNPSWMGYSVGRWEGDTLVVQSNGFNDRTWLDRDGHPHTDALRTTERYRRRDVGHMDIEMTLQDPAVYARPWTVALEAVLAADTELLEYVCNENQSFEHWIGRRSDDKAKVTVAQEVLATYVGTYEEQPRTYRNRNPGRVLHITFHDGQLFGSLDGGGQVLLLAQSETLFYGLLAIEFVKDGGGSMGIEVTGQMGGPYTFKRTK